MQVWKIRDGLDVDKYIGLEDDTGTLRTRITNSIEVGDFDIENTPVSPFATLLHVIMNTGRDFSFGNAAVVRTFLHLDICPSRATQPPQYF